MDAFKAYEQAQKSAQECYSRRKENHQDPYVSTLDDFLEFSPILSQRVQKHTEIYTDHIIGTRTQARANSFASNFMPLLARDSELAAKWMNVYNKQSESGLDDPIEVYEVFGRYFVQEGNKRVSVFKFLKAPLILANVTHLEVEVPDTKQGQLYRAFLDFQKKTGLDTLLMSTQESYGRLLDLMGLSSGPDPEKQALLASLYRSFRAVYSTLELKNPLQTGDAFLIWLETYGLRKETLSAAEIKKELESIRAKLSESEKPLPLLLMDTQTSDKTSLFSLFGSPLKVAFINFSDPDHSFWTKLHIEAIDALENEMEGKLKISVYNGINTFEALDQALQEAIADHNHLIFTTHPIMLQKTNEYAVRYPNTIFLNCSLNPQTSLLRTYFFRSYEGLFLLGICAGIYTNTGQIGYIADYPIFGEIANINAFAIGVQMTCPQATVFLDWSTTKKSMADQQQRQIDIVYIAGEQLDLSEKEPRNYGLYDISPGAYKKMAALKVDWNRFYSKIISSVLNHSYKSDQSDDDKAISYWWGLSNELLKVDFEQDLNAGSMRLIHHLEKMLQSNEFKVFPSTFLKDYGLQPFINQIAGMDQLYENIKGTVPSASEMMENARSLIQLHSQTELGKKTS